MHECTPGRCYTTPRGRARADTAGVAFVLAAEANAADHVGRADRMGAHAVTHAAATLHQAIDGAADKLARLVGHTLSRLNAHH